MPDRAGTVLPSRHQAPLPLDRLILSEPPDAEAVPMDVLFVGGGPAGLAGAIELAKLVKRDAESGGTLGDVQIGVLEKAGALGEHSLSGAVVNPIAMRALFPELKDKDFPFRASVGGERVYFLTETRAVRLPTPPTMQNHGYYIGSLCEIVRWLGEKAEALGVNIFTGFPAASLLTEGNRVTGVRTAPSGLGRTGDPASGYTPPTDITAQITVLDPTLLISAEPRASPTAIAPHRNALTSPLRRDGSNRWRPGSIAGRVGGTATAVSSTVAVMPVGSNLQGTFKISYRQARGAG